MANEFNRQQVLDNISELLQLQSRRVGDLEQALGVSTGYISRLAKRDNESALSAEFVWRAAQFFNVTMDSLVQSRFARDDQMISYVGKFLNRLFSKTDTGELTWVPIHINDINSMLMGNLEMEYPVVSFMGEPFPKDKPQPSSDPMEPDFSIGVYGNNKVISTLCDTFVPLPAGTAYYTKINEDHLLYILCYSIRTEAGADDYLEFHMLDQRGERAAYTPGNDPLMRNSKPAYIDSICNTFQDVWEPLWKEMWTLYRLIKAHEYDLRISEGTKSAIDDFLKDDDDDDELPF